MNTIGIDHNLDRARIRKLLAIGLFATILTEFWKRLHVWRSAGHAP
jgi:hypothetical protein